MKNKHDYINNVYEVLNETQIKRMNNNLLSIQLRKESSKKTDEDMGKETQLYTYLNTEFGQKNVNKKVRVFQL